MNLVPRRLRAFTLIELIVVIVVMGILVAIGAFAYNAVVDNSHKSAARSSAEQVARDMHGVAVPAGVSVANLSDTGRAPVVADAADTGATVTFSAADAGTVTASVVRGDYCTPVAFSADAAKRGVLGDTVRGISCLTDGSGGDDPLAGYVVPAPSAVCQVTGSALGQKTATISFDAVTAPYALGYTATVIQTGQTLPVVGTGSTRQVLFNSAILSTVLNTTYTVEIQAHLPSPNESRKSLALRQPVTVGLLGLNLSCGAPVAS